MPANHTPLPSKNAAADGGGPGGGAAAFVIYDAPGWLPPEAAGVYPRTAVAPYTHTRR